jgi:hypothetical protein
VAIDSSATETLTVTNSGGATCDLSGFAVIPGVSDGSDGGYDGFELAPSQPPSLSIPPGGAAEVAVVLDAYLFVGAETSTLVFHSNDPAQPELSVPLTATLYTGCQLATLPGAVNFGYVSLLTSVSQSVTVISAGGEGCTLLGVGIGDGGDPAFSVSGSFPATVAVGGSFTTEVGFDEQSPDAPTSHAGTLVLETTAGSFTTPLTAVTPIGCSIVALPNPLTFGNVGLDQSLTEQLEIANVGNLPCTVTTIGLTPATDPLFTLAPTPAATTVKPHENINLDVTFDAAVATAPLKHTGTLTFESVDQGNATIDVPLSAYVNSACTAATPLVYTVDGDGTFCSFDPDTLGFTVIGTLDCPDDFDPLRMAVDLNGVAWVVYEDGKLFEVQTSNASCAPTSFSPSQEDIYVFGMGFLFDPDTGLDTLYVAGGPIGAHENSNLATLAFPSLEIATVGPLAPWGLAVVTPNSVPEYVPPDLAGTADGQLWGFAPGPGSLSGAATLAQLDPATGATLQTFSYEALAPNTFAMKFWGGYLWIFLDTNLVRVDRSTGAMETVLANTGHSVVGAGVSDCAPVQ